MFKSCLKSIERQLTLGIAAAAAMHSLMERQQDLSADTDPSIVKARAASTAKVAVAFAQAVVSELLGAA